MLSLVRGGLLVARYSDHGKSCKPDNSSNLTAFKLFQQPQKAGYVFYMFLCAVSMLLHSMEYVLLAQGTVKFIQSYKHIRSYLFKISRRTPWKWEFLGPIVLMLPLLLLACAQPVFAVLSELSYASNLNECLKHDTTVYFVYTALTLLTDLFAFFVRVVMILATIAVWKLWSPETSGQPNESIHSTNMQRPELNQLEEFVKDWSIVSTKYGELADTYKQIGQKVKCITQIFQTWFMLPWIIFFIVTSTQTKNALEPWSDNENPLPFSKEYYTLYIVSQTLSLLIPYLCALKMNMFHTEFHKGLLDKMTAECQNSSCRALASIMHIEKEEDYDFVPYVWGTDIKMRMDSPWYFVFLLLGIFFTISGSLYS